MSTPSRWMTSLGLTLALAGTVAFVPETPAAAEEVAPAAATLTRVEAKKVCMVNNTVFAKDQIPVQVEDRTYYSCCEMCKVRLAQDAAARAGVDPVSGKPVDKATAVIGALPDGSVLYFESQATFDSYAAPKKD